MPTSQLREPLTSTAVPDSCGGRWAPSQRLRTPGSRGSSLFCLGAFSETPVQALPAIAQTLTPGGSSPSVRNVPAQRDSSGGLLYSSSACPQTDSVFVAYTGNPLVQQALTDLVPSPADCGLLEGCQFLCQFRSVSVAGLQRKQRHYHPSLRWNAGKSAKLFAVAGWNQEHTHYGFYHSPISLPILFSLHLPPKYTTYTPSLYFKLYFQGNSN